MARLNYLELPVASTEAAKAFYAEALGWTFADFGPTYAATTTGDTDLGLQADAAEKSVAPLPVIEVDDLEATHARVIAAGGGALHARSSPSRAAGASTSATWTGTNSRR